MKKIFIAVVAVAMTIGLSSCAKECKCKYEVLGVSTEKTIELGDGQKCSDLEGGLDIGGSKIMDAKCTPVLF
ncbi:MAG: hypothetical protein HUJ91_05265 [Bacteroidales bacterium]|nr:hypothetical protein [Bacteroidales bacterium]